MVDVEEVGIPRVGTLGRVPPHMTDAGPKVLEPVVPLEKAGPHPRRR